ncbi:MAG: Ig-like domain-containing protein [Verrucomicrobiae bacterium]|nr:Ig-like domain-containing protein [Verrucomicrobiae bacterium]
MRQLNFGGLFSILLAATWSLAGLAVPARAQNGLAAVNLQVVENDTNNTTDSVTVTATLSINDLRVRGGSNRGDYNVQIGADCGDDVESGVLLSCVAENGRDNGEAFFPGANFCTSAVDYARTGDDAGGYVISTFQSPTGGEYNINVAAAFFPYTNWLGGLARNSGATNGGADDLFTGSPGLAPGTNFVEFGSGVFSVNLTNFGIDSRTDGVLLVCGGKNEANYALSQANPTNGTWNVFLRDNGSGGSAYEQDPVAFVYVPKTNNSVVSGKFSSDGTILIFSGGSPAFNVASTGTGTWRLTIPGQTPASGVLLISAEGGGNQNGDNIVSYQPDGDGWVIQSRDLPASPPPLQSPKNDPVASFVFLPSLAPALLSPTNTAGLGASPVLKAAVPNALAGQLTVTFYGRPAGTPNTNRDFTIAALPDSQYYSASMNGGKPAMFAAQTDWVVAQRTNLNVAFVTHLGDITDHGQDSGDNTEWLAATNAMYRLENPRATGLSNGIPYGMGVGNHDQTPNGGGPTANTSFFNQYFGASHFTGDGYYGGHYGTNNNNSYQLFTAGGLDFIAIHLEYDSDATTPSAPALAWANRLLQTYASRRAIVTSHWIVNTGDNTTFSPQGRAIYTALRTNANLCLMLCGHISGEGRRTDVYAGRTVYSILTDFQSLANGGNGWLRYYTFSPSNNILHAFTYSPWLGQYNTNAASQFDLPCALDLNPSANPFTAIRTQTFTGASNQTAAFAWSGLASGRTYQWYAVAADAAGNRATSSVAWFQTQNIAPVAASQSRVIQGDLATNLVLNATDANGDALTFQTNSFPTHGLLQNFDPADGTVTYVPARGYRGADQFTFSANDGLAGSGAASFSLTVVAPADLGTNGLPAAWKTLYGITDPDGDADGDGVSNLEEFLAGTNPTNAASVLRLGSPVRDAAGRVELTWPSVGGTRYRVQYCNGTNGLDGEFLSLVRSVAVEMDAAAVGTVSTQRFVDDGSLTGGLPAAGARFYRLQVVQ